MDTLGILLAGACFFAGPLLFLLGQRESSSGISRSLGALALAFGAYTLFSSLEYRAPDVHAYQRLIQIHGWFTVLVFPAALYFLAEISGRRALWPWLVWGLPQLIILGLRQVGGPASFWFTPPVLVINPGLWGEPLAVLRGEPSLLQLVFQGHLLLFNLYFLAKVFLCVRKPGEVWRRQLRWATLGLSAAVAYDVIAGLGGWAPYYWSEVGFTGFVLLAAILFYRSAWMQIHLKRQVSLLETAVQQMPVQLFLTDTENRLLYRNQAWTPEPGARLPDPGEALEGAFQGWTPEPAWPEILSRLAQGESLPVRWRSRQRSLRSWAGPVNEAEGGRLGYFWILRETTLEDGLEEKYRRVQSLDHLGLMAAGLAHDFRNSLHSIQAAMDLSRIRAEDLGPAGAPVVESLGYGTAPLNSAMDLARRILRLGRGGADTPSRVNWAEAARRALKQVQALADGGVDFRVSLPEAAAWVEADALGLEQALVNLLQNGLQALSSGPGPGNNPAQERRLELSLTLESPATWRLTVADTGVGMEPEVQARLFEPFFSTRQGEGGTGLGLAQVWAVFQRARGSVEVETTPGRGSRFILRLPEVSGPGPLPQTGLVEPSAG